MTVDHEPLPDGHWWGCEYPERPPGEEIGATHWKRGCPACFVSWRAAAENPRATFLFHHQTDGKLYRLIPGRQSEADLRIWFMVEPGWEQISEAAAT